jgi:hypothetical protein
VLDIPFWKIQGTLDITQAIRTDRQASGNAEADPESNIGETRLLWTSMDSLPDPNTTRPVRFCLLKGSLRVDGEIQSVYGVGMMEP